MEKDGQIYGVDPKTGRGRRDREVLFLLPDEFVDAYVRLFWKTFVESGKGTDYERKLKENAGGGVGGGKKYREDWVIRSEKYFRLKGRVDQMLRAIAGEIGEGSKGLREGPEAGGRRIREELKRCGGVGCGRFMNTGWVFCPFCGFDLRRNSERQRERERLR